MLPENLERKVQILTADPTISLVHSAAEILVEKTAPVVPADWIEKATEDFVAEGRRYFRKLVFQGNLICAPTVVTRRQSLLDLGGFDEELGYTPDLEMWMKLCVEGQVAFLSQPLILYRWHEKNASHAYRFEQGVEESLAAGRKAIQHYMERRGQREEGEILQEAAAALARVRRWAAELDRGRAWLEGQVQSWQQAVEEREKMIEEQKAWIAELEKGRTWLEGQVQSWQQAVEEREKMIEEQKAWIAELEKGRTWLEGQVQNWQAEAERRQAVIEELHRQWVPQPLRQMAKKVVGR
jgi:exonuclease VII small subunit